MQDIRRFMADFNFYKGYSRFNEEKGRYETWDEAVERVMNMHKQYYDDRMSDELLELMNFAEQAYKEKRVLGAQRALQFGGEQLLKHHARNYNCSSSYADRPEFFGEYAYLLLCGCGVGFSVQKHHVEKLPKVALRKKQPKTFVVPDSIEGWAQAFDILMSSFFVGGGKYPEYEGRRVYFDLSKIRPKGAPISGGFKAPGPEPLRKALDSIEFLLQGKVLKHDEYKLKPIDVYDICMYIADCVISGGVRRSATICLFSKDDEDMLKAKTGNWFEENPQRARSNNSIVLQRGETTREEFREIIENIKQFGEPGFFFVDDIDITTNPCCEIGFYPQFDGKSGFGFCNLTEINGSKCTDINAFLSACRAAALLGTLQAGYTDFKFVSETTKKIAEYEALLGVSVTGWLSNPDVLLDPETMRKGVDVIKKTNEEVAELIGINPAARLTCVKPSGNASVILGTASGIHPEHSRRYIRNIQINKETNIAKLMTTYYPEMVEDSVWSNTNSDYVVSFPIDVNANAYTKDEVNDVKFLEIVKKVQENWVIPGTIPERGLNDKVTHNVSNTVVVKDWDGVTDYIFGNQQYFTGITLISEIGDKVYKQAPFIKVMTEKEILDDFGTAAFFASGLIVDGITAFGDLWDACASINNNNLEGLQKDWIRRFKKFADKFFDGDLYKTEMCLKNIHTLHRYETLKRMLNDKFEIDWSSELKNAEMIDIDTMAAQACAGGKCEF